MTKCTLLIGCSRYRYLFYAVAQHLCRMRTYVNWMQETAGRYEVSNAVVCNNSFILGHFMHYGVARNNYLDGWRHHQHSRYHFSANPDSVSMIQTSANIFQNTFCQGNTMTILFSSFTWDILRYIHNYYNRYYMAYF